MTTNEARKAARTMLADMGIAGTVKSVRTVSFQDLARADAVFVTLAGVPVERWADIFGQRGLGYILKNADSVTG